jgi:hypothetical protein
MMEDYKISEVAKILTAWNPLGDDAEMCAVLVWIKADTGDPAINNSSILPGRQMWVIIAPPVFSILA